MPDYCHRCGRAPYLHVWGDDVWHCPPPDYCGACGHAWHLHEFWGKWQCNVKDCRCAQFVRKVTE